MERISIEDYKKKYGDIGLQHFTQPMPPQTNALSSTLKDVPSDIVETGKGIGAQLGGIYGQSKAIIQDQNFTPAQKVMGVFGKFAGGVSGAIGEGVIGAGKLALSPASEAQIKGITQSVAQGVAQTDAAKAVIHWYDSLNKNDKLFVDSVGGVASFISDVFAPGVTKLAIKPVVTGVKTAGEATMQSVKTAGEATVQGVKTAVSPIIQGANTVVSNAPDIAKGLGTQVKDFGQRVVTGAIDTAAESRRLATLPAPEANLIRSGVDEAAVKLMKESTPAEQTIYKDLVAKAKTSTGNLLAEQPKVVVGQEFMKPVSHLLDVRDVVGKKLGDVRKGLSNAPMDVTAQFKKFQGYLDNRGITVDSRGKFTGSGNMAPSDLRELQKLYNEIRPDNTGKVVRSQKWIDQWNQRTYKEYDLRQAREQTFSNDVTRTVEQARSFFKEALPPVYRTLSTQYSEVMKPIEDVVNLLGYKGDITKLSAKEIKAAEVAMRIIGNASDRPQAVIDSVINTANKYGYTSDVNLKKVVLFADALEGVYPNITPKRGFTGSVTRGVNQSGVGVAADLMTGNVKGVLGQALNSTASQKEIQQALDKFLGSLN